MKSALLLYLFGALSAADVEALLDGLRAEQDVAGISATVVRHDREVFSGGSGFADLEAETPMTGDTMLYAGSLSKIFTSTLTLSLVDDGLMTLDDGVPVIAKAPATVTVAHLLTHTSGLPREGNFGYWFSAQFPDRVTLRRFLEITDLRTPPGQTVRYSNIGFAALGLAIESAAGGTYAELLHERVTAPLGMTGSGAPGPVGGIAPGYSPPGRLVPNEERPFAGVGRAVGDRHLREYHDAKAMTPAFGVYTTTRDLGRLSVFLLGYGGDEVVSPALRRRLLEPTTARRTLGLGLGTRAGHRTASHSGWFAAHRSYLVLDLDAGIGVAVIANGDNADPDSVAGALLDLARDALTGAP